MLDETPAQLVAHLSHPNGWWRDTAQQLLVYRQDRSVVPALTELVRSSDNQLARIHALWTLEGLGAAEPDLVRAMMKDPDPQIRIQAIRVSETLYKAGDRSFGADYVAMTKDADVDVVIQALLTTNLLRVADGRTAIQAAYDTNKAKGVQLVAGLILNPPAGRGGRGGGGSAFTPAEEAVLARGERIYTELCFACHGEDARGEPVPGSPGVTRAPSLVGSPRVLGHRDYVIKTLLHGLSGPIDDTRYSEVMIPMGFNSDEWIADVASYVRNAFTNRGSFVTPADVARVRAATEGRTASWAVDELMASLPRQLVVAPAWTFSASHNEAVANYAVSIQPWTTGAPQAPGMWFQVELPEAVTLTEIQFESPAVSADAEPVVAGAPPRTGGGRGGQPAVDAFPVAYQVQVSMDGSTWGQPVATGHGTGEETTIAFAPVRAKFVRITQTGNATDARFWSMRRLRLFEAP